MQSSSSMVIKELRRSYSVKKGTARCLELYRLRLWVYFLIRFAVSYVLCRWCSDRISRPSEFLRHSIIERYSSTVDPSTAKDSRIIISDSPNRGLRRWQGNLGQAIILLCLVAGHVCKLTWDNTTCGRVENYLVLVAASDSLTLEPNILHCHESGS